MTYPSKVTWIFLLGFALDLVNMFVATVAYPDIARELHASVTQLAWVGNAYMLGLTVIIPFSVWLAAMMGERGLMVVSLLLFAGASVMVGQASSIEALIGWRLLQGLGGGLLIPVGQAMAYRHFPPAERSQLTARVMSVALLVPALSPALGGLIVDSLSWRWIFYANLPLALITLLLAQLWIKPDTPTRVRPKLEVRRIFKQVSSPMLRIAMLVYLFIPGVFIGTSLIAILYLHDLGYDATQTGALMLPWAMASALAIFLGKKTVQSLRAKTVADGGHGAAMQWHSGVERTGPDYSGLRLDGPGRQLVQQHGTDAGVSRHPRRTHGPRQRFVEYQSANQLLPGRSRTQCAVVGLGFLRLNLHDCSSLDPAASFCSAAPGCVQDPHIAPPCQ